MKLRDITKLLEGIPYTTPERGRNLYEHIIRTRPTQCLELGFAHGVASCYIAAALHEIGHGQVTCVDLLSSQDREPNLEQLVEKAQLQDFVRIHRETNSYTWWLKKEIEANTREDGCRTKFDFCFIGGPKNWTIDGCAFFLVDKLLCNGGWVAFDDYRWTYEADSRDIMDGIITKDLSEDQRSVPNIELVFQLLVMQHPSYSNFVIDEDWAWAQKINLAQRTAKIITTRSVKYRILKMLKRLARRNGR